MRKIEFRKNVHKITFQPCLHLYVGKQKLPITVTEELIYDLGAIGVDAGEELFRIFKEDINANMLDIEFGLTLEEISKIGQLIREKSRKN